MKLQQLFCPLLVALLACKDVAGAPPDIGNRLYEGDRLYEGNLARYLQALHAPPAESEFMGLSPRLSPRYSAGDEWTYQREPSYYLLPELEEQRDIRKRVKPSLSIVNSLDVLRRRVLLDMIRRQETEKNKQAEVNRQILQSVGKRDN